jgi:Lrp/AsnC family transcriptional regulator, regulator for asnA, asnC and gidA
MNLNVELDEIDYKILGILIEDARAKLKDIAETCGISSVAVIHRIRRLRKKGVITGATLYTNLQKLGGIIVATLGIDLEAGQEEEVFRLIREQTNLIEPSLSVGKYDLCALVFSETLANLENTTQAVKKHKGVRRVTANIWVAKPTMILENIDLKTEQKNTYG